MLAQRYSRGLRKDDFWLHQADLAAADALCNRTHCDQLSSPVDQLHPVTFISFQVPEQDGLAVNDPLGLLTVSRQLWKRQGNSIYWDPALLRRCFGSCLFIELLQGDGLVDVKGADLDSPELGEMGSTSE
jgi:hypothetical protein